MYIVMHEHDDVGQVAGELAQLVERVLSMHEVAGSIPAFSRCLQNDCGLVAEKKTFLEYISWKDGVYMKTDDNIW